MAIRKPVTSLPDWAFKALGSNSLETLIDRTEHEIIVMTRRGVPELVLLSSAEWTALLEAARKPHYANPTAEAAEENA